ncbi:VWA domain-containing protein [Pendulispora rubella]|uniref:VWA domain-containing protein n=1 Tax=Pendulispora rubella TaxID=2741070 RepID=A0ABZ2KV68_9BACT
MSFLSFALFALGLTTAACGSGRDDSTFNNSNATDDPTKQDPGGSFGSDPLGPGGVFSACVTSATDAALTPANLVIMYDRSGSMGDTNNSPPFDPKLKWIPVSTGMKAFLADPGSKSMNASIQFFPLGDTNDTAEQVCSYNYADPEVKLTPLSESTPLVTAINTTRPQGGTPTLPALRGAVSYAKSVAATKPRDATVVVLVTDGEPGISVDGKLSEGCPNNNIPTVAKTARDAYLNAPSIRTYVIGVGPALDSLNAVAAAGGTEAALMIDVRDPSATTGLFQKALERIRSQTLSCDFAIPPPPAGRTLDPKQVNVVYSAGAKHQVLSYSKDCANGAGWRYDNPDAPTKITLCPTMCTGVQSDRDGKLTLAFGCATQVDVR